MITQTTIPIITCRRGYYLRWFYNGWHHWNFMAGTVGYATDGEKYRTTGIRIVELSSGVVNQNEIAAIRSILNAHECYVYTDGGFAECRVESGMVVVQRNRINAYELILKTRIGSRNITPTGYSVGITKPIIVPVNPTPGDLCEILIDGGGFGSQTWLCKNWNAGWPGSKVYDNDEINRESYGGLYSWAQIHEPGFVPAGWHLPTFAEITAFVGIVTNLGFGSDVGGILKEIGFTHWNSPNTGAADHAGWSARGGGRGYLLASSYGDPNVHFTSLKSAFYMWYDETYAGGEGYVFRLNYDSDEEWLGFVHQNNVAEWYCSVRFIKD